jgi:hypothetical protein
LSRAALIDVYISGLELAEVVVVANGRQCRIITGEPAAGEKIKARYYFKPSHAELTLLTLGAEGLAGKHPAALADAIERTAGEPWGANHIAGRAPQGRRAGRRRDRRAH